MFGTTEITPEIPSGLSGKGLIKGARLSWNINEAIDKSGQMLGGYKLLRSDSQKGKYKEITVIHHLKKHKRGKSLEFIDSNLIEGKIYFYKISAFNMKGVESLHSAVFSVVVLAPPANFKAEEGGLRKVNLSWNRIEGKSIKGYVIYRSSSKNGLFNQIKKIRGPMKNSFTDKLKDNNVYYYKIMAFDKYKRDTSLSEVVSGSPKISPEGLKDLKPKGR